MGMSGGLFVNALLRGTGLALATAEVKRKWHWQAYARPIAQVRPLPGVRELRWRPPQIF